MRDANATMSFMKEYNATKGCRILEFERDLGLFALVCYLYFKSFMSIFGGLVQFIGLSVRFLHGMQRVMTEALRGKGVPKLEWNSGMFQAQLRTLAKRNDECVS